MNPKYAVATSQIDMLRDYVLERQECMDYVLEVAETLDFIRRNEEYSREVANELDKWVCQEGHVLRYHTERLAVVLASKDELNGAKHAKQVRDKVLSAVAKPFLEFSS